MTKGFGLAALLALTTFSPATLAAPPSEAQVDRLLEVMRAEQTIVAMVPQIMASQQQMAAQIMQGADPGQQAAAERATRTAMRAVQDTINWNTLRPLYRDIYARTFTAEDTEAMITFYASPGGQSLLDKTPMLMQNTMAAVQTLVMPLLQQLEQDLRSELDATPPAG
ncbi:MAG: DUF2059 domain-containing protein [Luteimonas sp.]